ncbi:MAG TPA: hypothetical protein VNU92_18385 [Edaphobacter sp.]|jgi:hypothetical protein|nr:hypothetical protein [Edaphobacter sp.]
MRRFFICVMVFALFSVPVFAKENSEKVTVPSPLRVGSTVVAAGDYNVTWDGAAPEVKVSFLKNKKVICTVPAKLIEQNNKDNGIETGTQGGAEVLQRIRFAHVILEIENPAP